MPIIATASSRPATRNICTRSTGSSSGCRAEPSMKRPPRMPKPIAVPAAPSPKMMPTASTVMAWMCAISIQVSCKKEPPKKFRSVMFAGQRQVDDGQHHEDEGLQHDDEDVEDRPHHAQQQLGDDREPAAHGQKRVEPALQRQHRDQE